MKLLSDKKNIFFGLIFSYVALAVSLVGSFLITPIVLNNIGDKNYGLFSFCNSITSWLAIISTSLGSAYMYFAHKEKKECGEESKTNTLFAKLFFCLSGLVVVFSFIIIRIMDVSGFMFSNYSVEENKLIRILLLISSITVAVTIFFSAFSLYNNLKKSFAYIRGVSIVLSISSYLLNLLLATSTKSVIPIAIVAFGSALINGILNLFYAFKVKKMFFKKTSLQNNQKEIRSIIVYSGVIILATIIGNLDSNLDKTLLGIMVNAESVTMYQLSITFAAHLSVLSITFVEVMRPTIYELYRNDRISEANSLFLKVCKMQLIVILFVIGGYISCGYHFVTLWIGSQRIDVFFYSSVLFLSYIVPLTKRADEDASRATNSYKIPTIISIFSMLVNISISILLIIFLDSKYAVWACIIGTIIPRFIFNWIVIPIYDYKKIKLPMKMYYLNVLKNFVIMGIAVLPSIVLTYFLQNYDISLIVKIIIEGFAFVIIYLAEIFIFERKTLKIIFSTFSKRS